MATASELQRMQLRFEAALTALVRDGTIKPRTPEEIHDLVLSCMLEAADDLHPVPWDTE